MPRYPTVSNIGFEYMDGDAAFKGFNSLNAQAKQDRRKKLFGTSPLYDGTYTHEKMISVVLGTGPDGIKAAMLPEGPQTENPMYPEGVRLDFTGSPDMETVVTQAGAGTPGTPWTPNLASPGEGNGDDPTKQPADGLATTDIRVNVVPGKTDNTVSPSTVGTSVSSRDEFKVAQSAGATFKLKSGFGIYRK